MGDRRDRFFKRTLRTPKQDFEEVHIGKPKEDSVDFSFVMGQQLKFNVHCIFLRQEKLLKVLVCRVQLMDCSSWTVLDPILLDCGSFVRLSHATA